MVLLVAGSIIVASLVVPGHPAIGLIGLFGGFFVIASLLFKRPLGRPPKSASRRISGYATVDSVSAPFQNVLVAVALWQAAELLPQRVVTGSEMAVAGLVSGLCWGLLARLGANAVAEVVGAVLSAAALAAFVGSAWSGNECLGVEARVGLYAVVATVVGTAAVAALVAMTQWATLRRASLGSYALAIVGLVELAQFAVAPTGEVLDAVPWWAWPIGVTGFCAVAFLTAVNPRAATSLVGAMVALAALYLVAYDLGLSGSGGTCTSLSDAAWVIVPFVVTATLAAGADG